MSATAGAQSVRLGRHLSSKLVGWLAIGVVLAAIAVFASKLLVTPAGHYWVVTEDTPANANFADVLVEPLNVNLAASASAYLSSAVRPSGFTTRALHAGEIISRDSLAAESAVDLTRVVISTQTALSGSIKVGTEVAIWAAPKIGSDYSGVELLIQSAQVVKLIEAKTPFADQSQNLEVQLSALALPGLLDAISNESALYVVANS